MVVDTYPENNMTASMVPVSPSNNHYWLGLASVDDLRTNTLESAAGALVSQYAGFWDLRQPNAKDGECVDVHVTSDSQSWELTTCETLLPFMCKANACPAGKYKLYFEYPLSFFPTLTDYSVYYILQLADLAELVLLQLLLHVILSR